MEDVAVNKLNIIGRLAEAHGYGRNFDEDKDAVEKFEFGFDEEGIATCYIAQYTYPENTFSG